MNQLLDGFAGFGELLHFVEDDQRLALVQWHLIIGRQVQEKRVQVAAHVMEVSEHIIRREREVDHQAGLIFALAEFLCDDALANPPGAFNEQRRRTI